MFFFHDSKAKLEGQCHSLYFLFAILLKVSMSNASPLLTESSTPSLVLGGRRCLHSVTFHLSVPPVHRYSEEGCLYWACPTMSQLIWVTRAKKDINTDLGQADLKYIKSEKCNDPFPRKNWKCPMRVHFWPFLPNLGKTRFFQKNLFTSLLSLYTLLTVYKKSEKYNDPFPRKNWKCPNRVPFWALFARFGKNKIFP